MYYFAHAVENQTSDYPTP